MACLSFDVSSGWWSIRYYAGAEQGRIKKTLCKHPGPWTRARPPRKPPDAVKLLAAPFEEAERLARLGIATPARDVALGAHLEAYLARKRPGWARNTDEAVSNAVRKFRAYCEGRGVRTLRGVTHVVCRDWIAARRAGGAKRSTVVTERSNLMPIWTEAAEDNLVERNPWDRAKVPGKARKEIPTAWTAEEAARLVGALEGWLRDLVVVGLNTGIRIEALLALRWPQVDWAAGLVRVRAADSKSGRPYEVPLTAAAHDVLARRLTGAEGDRGPIFVNPATGRPYSSKTTFDRIGLAVRNIGISDHGDYNHCMRRTFATLALNAGVPMEVVSRCLGHATLAQTERAYCHVKAERAIKAMEGFSLGGQGPGPPPPPAGS